MEGRASMEQEKQDKKVSPVVVRRLSRYYRYLSDLEASGVERVSSKKLSERMNSTASQIRQDLNCFGGFGQQGYGYNVAQLKEKLADILGLNRGYKTILIGAGNLGHSLANYAGFEKRGFRNIAIFDTNPEVIGTKIHGIPVQDISKLKQVMEKEHPEIAMLAIPKAEAQRVSQKLAEYGIKGIWNFSHMDIKLDGYSIPVENVHLSDSLMTLSYRITDEHEMGK